jgi:hypothetical protein
MVDIVNKCKIINCKNISIYGFPDKKLEFCEIHKSNGMINRRHKKCKSEFCNISIKNNKYKNYCIHCFVHLFPNDKISTNYKTKENEIKKFIFENHKDKKWIYDKVIENGSSKRRPDFLLELEDQVIIIEVDENQHSNYDCICENKRIMEISKDLNHTNIIFIRFNPDNYININNKLIDSCWKININGLLSINDLKLWDNRLQTLNEQINYWCINKTNKTIEIIQLYYDGFL